jgi:hypothetical protein
MPLSAFYSRIGAMLALTGTVVILWSFLSVNINNVLSNLIALGVFILILLLLIINGVALFTRLPTWLAIIRIGLLVCGFLMLLYGFGLGLSFRCFDRSPCPALSLADFFHDPFAILTGSLGGLLLNLLGSILSRWR